MNKFLIITLGIITGLLASLLFVGIVGWLYPLLTGSGGDNMTQGIMGTIILFFSAPLFAIAGGVIAYIIFQQKR